MQEVALADHADYPIFLVNYRHRADVTLGQELCDLATDAFSPTVITLVVITSTARIGTPPELLSGSLDCGSRYTALTQINPPESRPQPFASRRLVIVLIVR